MSNTKEQYKLFLNGCLQTYDIKSYDKNQNRQEIKILGKVQYQHQDLGDKTKYLDTDRIMVSCNGINGMQVPFRTIVRYIQEVLVRTNFFINR